MKNYIVMDPSKNSAKYEYYGNSPETAKSVARHISERTGMLVPIDYEIITDSGTIKETGTAWPRK